MKSVLLMLLATLAIVAALEAPPKPPAGGDALYGVYTIFGGQYTETIVQTGSIDISSGTITPITTNFVYAGSSITYDGISTFDQANGILHYATDFSSAFVFGVDVGKQQLAPPIDFGASGVDDIDYNGNDGNIYALVEVETEEQTFDTYYLSYSTGTGPASIVANFTNYLASTGAELGPGAINTANAYGTPSDYIFVSFVGTEQYINIYNATTGQFNGTAITGPCANNRYFEKFWYNSTNGQAWGVQETIVGGKSHYFHAQINPVTGSCTTKRIEVPEGIVTALTFSPASGTVYFANAASDGQICSAPVADDGVGSVTCVTTTQVLADLEVAYPSN